MSQMSQLQAIPGHRHHRTAPLTRAECIKIINGGESVMVGTEIIKDIHLLPSEAEFAIGDPVKEQAARTNLLEEMEKLRQMVEKIDKAQLQPVTARAVAADQADVLKVVPVQYGDTPPARAETDAEKVARMQAEIAEIVSRSAPPAEERAIRDAAIRQQQADAEAAAAARAEQEKKDAEEREAAQKKAARDALFQPQPVATGGSADAAAPQPAPATPQTGPAGNKKNTGGPAVR